MNDSSLVVPILAHNLVLVILKFWLPKKVVEVSFGPPAGEVVGAHIILGLFFWGDFFTVFTMVHHHFSTTIWRIVVLLFQPAFQAKSKSSNPTKSTKQNCKVKLGALQI